MRLRPPALQHACNGISPSGPPDLRLAFHGTGSRGGMHARSTRGQTARMAQEFKGVIAADSRDSTPWGPPEPTPPSGAPNVLLIVVDDVGFAQLGCYGSDISTPNIDPPAPEGGRAAHFPTTALCSPPRSCLLTGRTHHRNGMARVADLAIGYPGYNAIV